MKALYRSCRQGRMSVPWRVWQRETLKAGKAARKEPGPTRTTPPWLGFARMWKAKNPKPFGPHWNRRRVNACGWCWRINTAERGIHSPSLGKPEQPKVKAHSSNLLHVSLLHCPPFLCLRCLPQFPMLDMRVLLGFVNLQRQKKFRKKNCMRWLFVLAVVFVGTLHAKGRNLQNNAPNTQSV